MLDHRYAIYTLIKTLSFISCGAFAQNVALPFAMKQPLALIATPFLHGFFYRSAPPVAVHRRAFRDFSASSAVSGWGRR